MSKPRMSMVVVGHVDAGKSTTSGHLLALGKVVSAKDMAKLKSKATDAGRGSFMYAWIMDNGKAERDRGVTIDCAVKEFETSKLAWTLIDAPGHRDYLKNAVGGIAQADVAMLVVASRKGEFEVGLSDGQTREHLLLAHTLGIKRVVVAVNKMDTVDWDESRYEEIKAEVLRHLGTIGFRLKTKAGGDAVPFVPISGFKGDNMMDRSDNTPWYKGPTLMEALDGIKPPPRPVDKPLRVLVSGAYTIRGVGTVVAGRLEAGTLKTGAKVAFALAATPPKGFDVRSIEMHGRPVDVALPGDNVGINIPGVRAKDIRRGDVIGPHTSPPVPVKEFTARLVVLKHKAIRPGFSPVLDIGSAHMSCRFDSIIQRLDRRTGEVVETDPAIVKTGDAAIVKIVPTKALVVQTFKDCASLGRFAVRDSGHTVAVGLVTAVEGGGVGGGGGGGGGASKG